MAVMIVSLHNDGPNPDDRPLEVYGRLVCYVQVPDGPDAMQRACMRLGGTMEKLGTLMHPVLGRLDINYPEALEVARSSEDLELLVRRGN
ncbi:MAG: hypothetical protein A3D44_03350 [Candidatus Staskawiczbacteria bacterium RIFCSPHIGHO2_02_FULL_42_22]|uniref:Uncharacterized protein n=1 Tax=Candidatus Staskawiczbacteria bacterium RIFCSPHIGHO2_02_FULL_42_22 TaxID=1802207 RepID=A0A1G2I4B7_9BACT|nr:MAG: hypothetical protein A3D44_03350 [Candidatus Staskawiczbacteria bacterium RIFCSPHIGHO2_02_FULL_42_22]